MAFRFSFFSTPKHRVFTYKPLYYDAAKEDFNERVERARSQVEQGNGAHSPTGEGAKSFYKPGNAIRGGFHKARLYETPRRGSDNRLIRLVVIVSILLLFAAVFFFADRIGFILN